MFIGISIGKIFHAISVHLLHIFHCDSIVGQDLFLPHQDSSEESEEWQILILRNHHPQLQASGRTNTVFEKKRKITARADSMTALARISDHAVMLPIYKTESSHIRDAQEKQPSSQKPKNHLQHQQKLKTFFDQRTKSRETNQRNPRKSEQELTRGKQTIRSTLWKFYCTSLPCALHLLPCTLSLQPPLP